MAPLHDLLSARLENLRTTSGGGWTAACPVCRAEGHDSQRNHLRIFPSGAFHCAKVGADKTHNRGVRAWIYAGSDPDTLASLDLQIVDPEPKLEVEKVYPEEMLARLVPDHRYWVGRGISEDVLRRMGGGLAPLDERSKLSGRYIFPVRDDKGRIVGWTGRLVSEASFGPTWKHLCKASKVVFPIHDAEEEIRRTRKVVLDESVGDGLSLATVGLRNRIDLLGLNLNARILGFLVSVNPTHIVVSTNNDAVGAKGHSVGNTAAEKVRTKLVPFFGEERVLVRLPQAAKDWNDVLKVAPDELRAFKAEVDAL